MRPPSACLGRASRPSRRPCPRPRSTGTCTAPPRPSRRLWSRASRSREILDALIVLTAPAAPEAPPAPPWAHLLGLSLDAFAATGAALGVRVPRARGLDVVDRPRRPGPPDRRRATAHAPRDLAAQPDPAGSAGGRARSRDRDRRPPRRRARGPGAGLAAGGVRRVVPGSASPANCRALELNASGRRPGARTRSPLTRRLALG